MFKYSPIPATLQGKLGLMVTWLTYKAVASVQLAVFKALCAGISREIGQIHGKTL